MSYDLDQIAESLELSPDDLQMVIHSVVRAGMTHGGQTDGVPEELLIDTVDTIRTKVFDARFALALLEAVRQGGADIWIKDGEIVGYPVPDGTSSPWAPRRSQ